MDMRSAMGKRLKAEELGPKFRKAVVIDNVQMEKTGTDTKPVMYFRGNDKGLVLNKTNVNALIDILGSAESDDWIGRRVQIYTAMVDYQGKRVLGIRIEEAVVPQQTQTTRPAPRPAPAREPGSDDGEFVPADDMTW